MDSLESIERIDGLGIFDKYERGKELPNFGRFNVFYGSNGSGKTTFTRLFACLNSGTSEEHPDLKYSIKLDSGGSTREIKEGQPLSPSKIRVFNSDYITNNIGQIDGQLNPIFIIGEENQELVEQIRKDEKRSNDFNEHLATGNNEKTRLVDNRGKVFTDIARILRTEGRGHITSNYQKKEAEKSYIALKVLVKLSDDEISNHQKTLRQEEKKTEAFEIKTAEIDKVNKLVQQIREDVPSVCEKTSVSVAIERLRQNPDIAEWVDAGRALHEEHSSGTCEYCQQVIPETRLNELSDHFNRSDALLKKEIESVGEQIKTVIGLIENLICPHKSELYDEMRGSYETEADNFEDLKNKLIRDLGKSEKILEDKLNKRTESLSDTSPHLNISDLEAAVKALNGILREHNQKSQKFDKHRQEAWSQIEAHHLTQIRDEVEDYDSKIVALKQSLGMTLTHVTLLKKRIKENRDRVSKIAQAATDITERLGRFLGREDLKLEVVKDEGYRLLRNGKPAKRLSEGEKTAIAFMYFVVQLKDAEFDLENGIVVIDDPVSSLDSNSLYQAFAFLKGAVEGAGQVFLLTHNYEFLKLLLNWLNHVPKKEYYMIFNTNESDGKRIPHINKLDKTLTSYKNEYAFLIKNLRDYKSDNTIRTSYPIPNIARKALETFLEFQIPGNLSMYKKLDQIVFCKQKKVALRKFLNDNSHFTGENFNPSLIAETENAVKYLLEMIEKHTPIYYEALEDASQA